MTKHAKEQQEVELHPDAWERFERAVGGVTKAPPQHKTAKKPKARSTKGKKPTKK